MIYVSSIQEFTSKCMPTLLQQLCLPTKNHAGCVYFHTGADSALLNGVYQCPQKCADTRATVDAITNYFHEHSVPHSWWVEQKTDPSPFVAALQSKGLKCAGEFPGMALDTKSARAPVAAQGLIIERVETKKDLSCFSEAVCSAFMMPEPVATLYASWFEKAGLDGPIYHVVGKKNGKVVSTGTLLNTDTGAYIYNISTIEGYRNKGYASNITYSLIEQAKELNCSRLALIACPMAVSLYQKLGLETVCRFEMYA